MSETFDFTVALSRMKTEGARVRRRAWKPNKYVWIKPATAESMSYPELVYIDGSGRRAPWGVTRCDLLEDDWEFAA
ncbi:DUF2829 domain-containing protein [Mesorhizobium sp. M00.F.Ca.ET.038.03.1.1]|nr:DUF2829 domain-containing protein [Mesorhizobium sp. M00.F.Ca.ET.038.03.1.1]TIW04127.1 MAG: DUF2829 domain-containing protein [Mesorhizobium sp.]